MQKATQIRDKIFDIDADLHTLSNILAKDIEWDGIDIVYLQSKFNSLSHTAKHIANQLILIRKEK